MAKTQQILWVALAIACAEPKTGTNKTSIDGENFSLEINAVSPQDQDDLFSQIDGLQLVVNQGDGTQSTHALVGNVDIQEGSNNAVPPLDNATLSLVGRTSEGQVVFHGTSLPLTLSEGSHSISIFIAQNNAMATLSELPSPLAMAPLVATGQAQFYFFGGAESGAREPESRRQILRLDLAEPNEEIAAYDIGVSLPSRSDGGGYMGHTATMIGGSGEQAGKVVIAGGAPFLLSGMGVITGQDEVSNAAFLFDPATETIEEIDGLSHARREHLAVTDPNGDVLVIGGFSSSTSPYLSVAEFVEKYDADEDRWDTASEAMTAGGLYAAAARYTNQGVLVCGGIDRYFSYTTACQLITSNGILEDAPSLAEPLISANMTTLADGRILLTGGLAPGAEPFSTISGAEIEATDSAWIYEGGNWRALDPMKNARAMHSASLLPGGRVLIAGGVSGIDSTAERVGTGYSGIMYDHALALACAETFDPDTERFTALDPCGEGSATATLPERTLRPAVATDETVGTIIAGGIGVDRGQSVDSVRIFHPSYGSGDAQ
ncbi:MAG: Kelch repeat-containing protein [Myxococcota bacterium]